MTAAALGGHAWERAGRIWYITLRDRLRPDAQFVDAARTTAQVAAELYGSKSAEARAVRSAWRKVGVL